MAVTGVDADEGLVIISMTKLTWVFQHPKTENLTVLIVT